ncbi:GNAT family N-acetyltransferase [Lacticaseibacillus saniviri]|nr:N-acetyltransferase [Lacticaseibacillus saniviri]MCG4282095.1 N-acetyltransferase [Lacticaseibacillus saniviri]
MIIKPVTAQTIAASLAVTQTAFADVAAANRVTRLRQSAQYRPDYDIVVVDDQERVVGHAMLMASMLADQRIWVLASLSVLPELQGNGLGGAMIGYLEAQVADNGGRAIAVMGDADYYQTFGFVAASQFDIQAPADVREDFLIKPMMADALAHLHGVVQFDSAFSAHE